MAKTLFVAGAAALALFAAPALAQDAPAASAAPSADRVNQVIVYGDDPCPASTEGELVVCARMSEDERYRIPPSLRGNPNDPRRESWTTRVQSVERIGRYGTDSCSPAGLGGFTGCLNSVIDNAYAERRQAAGTDWSTAVAAARAERMTDFDRRAAEVEAQVTADEQARVARETEAANKAEAEAEAAAGVDSTPLPTPSTTPPPATTPR